MDRAGDANSNSSNQSQIRPYPPNEILQSLDPSSSSPTDGNGERYPERISRPTIQVHPNVGPNVVFPHESPVAMRLNIPPSSQRFQYRFSGPYDLLYQGTFLPGGAHVFLPNHTPLVHQTHYSPHVSSPQQPIVYDPNFYQFHPVMTSHMNLRTSVSTIMRSQRTIEGSSMLGPQIGWGNQIFYGNLYFINGVGYFIGHLPNLTQNTFVHGNFTPLHVPAGLVPRFNMHEQQHPMEMLLETISFPGNVTPLHVPTGLVPRFNMYEQEYPIEILQETLNNSSAREITFPGESSQGSTSNPFEMEIQDGTNVEQNGQLQLAGGNAQQLPSLRELALFDPEMRDMLRTRDAAFREFSILVQSIEQQSQIITEARNANVEPILTGEQILTEEAILKSIRHENFKLIGEETPQTKETCCICQEEYADSEELGVLDCMHKYHIDCIKTWLVVKNSCPICKRKGITLNEE